MEYRIERYKNCRRFNEQYESICRFLLEAENRRNFLKLSNLQSQNPRLSRGLD